MKLITQRLIIIYSLLQLTACSMGELTVKASMPMIEGGMIALNREPDLQLAQDAMPANIALMEGMIINSPDNETLRNYAAQAYYGYAYGFIEDTDPQRAANFYQRGLKHALYNLNQSGLSQKILNGELQVLQKKLKSLDEDEVAALFWAASNWAKWIDHNRDKAEAIADLARAVMLMQRVMQIDETFFMAGPHVFFGVYNGSRSPMLGGNYTVSKTHFDKARSINNNQLLIVDLLQAQYLDRQQFDQQSFHQRLTKILNTPTSKNTDVRLINNIVKVKAKFLLEKELEWF
jgi:TRAP transporter TatT component family protein